MDIMVNSEFIKQLRKQKSWTQEQLARVSGLSLRTVQRIEKQSVCSLESKKSLASVLEVDAVSLDLDQVQDKGDIAVRRGLFWGMLGNTLGFVCAFAGITFSVINGNLYGLEAGLWYAGTAVFHGLSYIGIALFSEYCRKNKVCYGKTA
jgi:DNA-binding XRE family transcriptional regulator